MKIYWDGETANDIIDMLEEENLELARINADLAKENATLQRALNRAVAVMAYLERHHAMAA